MNDVAVVALEKVVDDVLPVRLNLVGQTMSKRQLLNVGCPVGDLRAELARLLGEGCCVRVEVDVDEPTELGDLDLIEADLGGVESDQAARAAGTGEVAVEVVGPGVIWAHQVAGGSRTRDEFVRPVLADVLEGLEFVLLGLHDDDRHPGDLCGDIATRLSDVLDMVDPLPGAGEGRLLLVGEPSG